MARRAGKNMNFGKRSLFLCALLLAGADASAETLAKRADTGCVIVRGEVRYRNYGYDHLVLLTNECEVRMICDVATSVNPEAVRISLAPEERAEVLTYRGSPAREFTPIVTCTPATRLSRQEARCSL